MLGVVVVVVFAVIPSGSCTVRCSGGGAVRPFSVVHLSSAARVPTLFPRHVTRPIHRWGIVGVDGGGGSERVGRGTATTTTLLFELAQRYLDVSR